MPGYKGHLAGGMVVFAGSYYVLHALGIQTDAMQAAQMLGCTLAGSLFPDMDVKSKGQNFFYKLVLVALLIFFFKGYTRPFIALSFAAVVPMLVRHRGLFHAWWFVICFPSALAALL